MAIEESTTAQEATIHGTKGIIYGDSGSGKTTLCGTTPHDRTLILSAESGLLTLNGTNIKVWKIKTVSDLTEAYSRLSKATDGWQYQHVHIDSITEVAEVVLANALKLVKDPRQAYGAVLSEVIAMVRAFRDLPYRNIWMMAKAVLDRDAESGVTKWMPMFPGQKLSPQMPYFFDEVFFLGRASYKDASGKIVSYRYLQTEYDAQHVAKDRSRALASMEPPDLAAITHKITTRVQGA